MSLATDRIAHLLFSTRHAQPESGSGFNREVVAESPGLSDRARNELANLSDMTGFVLQKRNLPPLWAFRRVDPDAWLLARAVSLGLYRKGNHQLLVHGLLLRRHHLDWLEGNPFLLSTPQVREAGFGFVEQHPDGQRELEPLRLDPSFATTATRLNIKHFSRLSAELGPYLDSPNAFPTLYQALLDRERTTAWIPPPGMERERPERRFLEWLLLHFHPADRAELSFHSWYAYDSPRQFDLVGVAHSDAEELQRQLRGDVSVWRAGGDDDGAEREPALGHYVQELRQKDPVQYWQTISGYYLTVLEPRFTPDLRERTLDVVPTELAKLCLAYVLGAELDEDQTQKVRRLWDRRESDLLHEARQLTEAWERDPREVATRRDRLQEAPISAGEREWQIAVQERLTDAKRWAFLALLPHILPSPSPQLLRQAWSGLLPENVWPGLLDRVEDEGRARLAEEILKPWMLALGPDGQNPQATAFLRSWEEYLRFLRRWQRPVLPALAALERHLERAGEKVRREGYRKLQGVALDFGLEAFALRLLLVEELPLLPEAARRVRAADGLRRLLGVDADPEELVGRAAADPVVAEVLFSELAKLFVDGSETEPVRLRAYVEAIYPGAATKPTGAALEAAAQVLASRARTPEDVVGGIELLTAGAADSHAGLADRMLRSTAGALARRANRSLNQLDEGDPFLPRTAALLVDLRTERPDSSEETDRALLDLLLPILTFAPPSDATTNLRRNFRRWLRELLEAARFPDLARHPREWRHLLLDELRRQPSQRRRYVMQAPPELAAAGAETDPVQRAYHQLAWQRWTEVVDPRHASSESRRAAEMGLLRGLARLGPAGHRELLVATMPRSRPGPEQILEFWSDAIHPSTTTFQAPGKEPTPLEAP